jgi:gliding motility-associated-like protein
MVRLAVPLLFIYNPFSLFPMQTIVGNTAPVTPSFFISFCLPWVQRIKGKWPFTFLMLLPVCGASALAMQPFANDTAFLSLSGANAICAGQTTTFSVDFTSGTAPFSFTPMVNGVAQAPVIANTEPVTFSLPIPAGINIIGMINATANSVPVVASGTVSVTGIQASGVLTGGGDLCFNGTGDSVTISFTGTGPFTFIYAINGMAQAPITTSLPVFKIFVNPVMYSKYQLVSLSAQGCPGIVSGIAEFFIYVSSNATLSGDLTFCNSLSTTLLVNLTGTAPFTLTYAINGQVQPPVTVQDSPIPIPANITQTTVYKLISIESPGCVQLETDSQVIFINYPPAYTNLVLNCNLLAGTYTASFDITGGTAPYTLLSGSGTFLGNQFVSQPIPIASNYNFSFRDANNCGNVMVTGPNTCNCMTKAGTVNTTPLELCVGEPATTTPNSDQVLDGNDVLRFILHTQPSLPTGTILAWSSTPDFAFSGALQTGVTYYVSAIAGNDAGNGQVALNDICLSVSPGRPVIWRPLPTASLPGDVEVCAGAPVLLPVQLMGSGIYDLTYILDGQSITATGVQAPFHFTGPFLVSSNIILTGISDANCSASLDDTARVVVYTRPLAGTPVLTCDQAAGTYNVVFPVISGDLPSVSIAGLSGHYDVQTGLFTSGPIAEADPFLATITDKWLCGADTVAGVSNCFCITTAGVLAGDTLRLCYGLPVNLQPVTGSAFTASDTLIYILATSTNPTTWNIKSQSNTPNIPFPSGPVIAGAVYYAMAVVGKKGSSGIVFSDPCLSLSNAVAVIWRNNITAAVSGNSTICAGQTTPLLIQLAGSSNYSFGLFANNVLYQAVTNANGSFNFYNVAPTVTTVYEVKNLIANGCPGTGVIAATVTVNPVPVIVGLQQICDADNLHYTLQFGISNGTVFNAAYTVSGITGVFISDTVFVSDSYNAVTPYTITVSSAFGCSSTTSGSGTCACATDAGTLTALQPDACVGGMVAAVLNNDAVLDQNDGLQYFICDDPALIPQSILATSNTPVFGFLPGMSIATIYFIFAVAGDLLPDGTISFTEPCTSLSGGVGVQFHAPPSVVLEPIDTVICKGQNFQIPLSLIGSPPFKFTYQLNGVLLPEITTNLPGFVISSANIQAEQVFEMVSISDANCSGMATGKVVIRVKERPVLTLTGSPTICPGQTASLTLQLDNANAASVEILSSNGPAVLFSNVQGTFVFTVQPSLTTTYSLGAVVFSGNDCPGFIQGAAKVSVVPVTTTVVTSNYNGYGVSCHYATDGSINLQPSGGNGPYTFLWSTGGGNSSLIGLSGGDYQYTVSDQTGCSGTGTTTVTEPELVRFQVQSVPPDCNDIKGGEIILETVMGGVSPYNMEFDHKTGVPINSLPLTIDGLPSGDYHLQITDINGCTAEDTEIVDASLSFFVELGPDQTIVLGDSIWLTAIVTSPGASLFMWSPANTLSVSDSSSVLAKPVRTTNYIVSVTNSEGCVVTEDIQITVMRDDHVFIPNIITPESGGDNAVMTVYAGREVTRVTYLRLYDRWGALIFDNNNFLPNDPSQGWNGRWKNKPVQPGVYFYVLEVEKNGGVVEVVKGDITVVR